MTEIKIKRLVLENFKCHKSLRLDFEGGNASIYGDNASGKTSIYDALTWLLFGKDSQVVSIYIYIYIYIYIHNPIHKYIYNYIYSCSCKHN